MPSKLLNKYRLYNIKKKKRLQIQDVLHDDQMVLMCSFMITQICLLNRLGKGSGGFS